MLTLDLKRLTSNEVIDYETLNEQCEQDLNRFQSTLKEEELDHEEDKIACGIKKQMLVLKTELFGHLQRWEPLEAHVKNLPEEVDLHTLETLVSICLKLQVPSGITFNVLQVSLLYYPPLNGRPNFISWIENAECHLE